MSVFINVNELFCFQSEATKISDISYTTVYKVIDCLTSNFEPEKLQPRDHLLSLCAVLLRHTSTADYFWESDADTGMRLTVDVALQRFPLDFEPLVHIVTSLASANSRSCEEVWLLHFFLDCYSCCF